VQAIVWKDEGLVERNNAGKLECATGSAISLQLQRLPPKLILFIKR
ncbi:1936_t:CDS:1, partial [Acaulospora colombiana]